MGQYDLTLNEAEALGRLVECGRVMAGWDQAKLARHAGLSGTTISNLERGKTQARKTTIRPVLKALREIGIEAKVDRVNNRIIVSTDFVPEDAD